MKRRTLTFIVACFLIFNCLFYYGCKKEGAEALSTEPGTEQPKTDPSKEPKRSARLSNGDYTCGDTLTSSFTGSGYYMYPARTINVSSLAVGTLVQVTVDLVEVPNRFSIYDGATLVATTGWVGSANYWGPWGASINSTQTTFVMSFAKSGTGIYTFKVETSTNPLSDSWNAQISCGSAPSGGGDGGGTPDTTCLCSNASFSGSYSGSGFYVYTDIILDAKCVDIGKTIQLACSYLDVPNRFSVYSASGSLVATTNWVGNASYYGPWGSSLNTSYSPVLSFTRSSTSAYYILRVETVRNTTYEDRNDAWDVLTSCY